MKSKNETKMFDNRGRKRDKFALQRTKMFSKSIGYGNVVKYF